MNGKHFSDSHFVLVLMYRNPLDRKGCRRIDVDAEALGIPLSTFQKYISGLLACPAEVLTRLYSITKDPRLKQLLTPPGHRIVPDEHGDIVNVVPTCMAFNEGLAQLGEFFRLYEQYRSDGVIDRGELEQLCAKGTLGVDAVEGVILSIKREAMRQ